MAEHQSSDALKKNREEEDDEEFEEEEEDEDESDKEEENQSGIPSVELQSSGAESRDARFETLAVPQLTEKDQCAGFGVNSATNDGAQFQEPLGISHQEVLAAAPNQPAQGQIQNLQQLSTYPTSLSELSPTSVTQSISPAPSPILPEQRLSLQKVNGLCTPEEDKQISSDFKSISPVPLVKTSASDGYNWRKYGQKQVKCPPGSRSYYRCTFSECSVKKIECCNISGHITEIVYKSQHTHDPPRRSNCTREIKVASSAECVGNTVIEYPCEILNDSELPTTSKEPIQENPIPERKRQNSNDSDGNGDVMIKEEHINEPESKRRLKKSNSEYSDSLLKPGKKPKFVVHAAGDVGISGDGYRWRKYGQKMVKGNPHPRNYYRCTSAGCPVRKHIETAVDNTSAVIITYKGIHDHDMPVPKKRHGPPSAPLVAAAAPASMNNLQIVKTDTEGHQSSTQWSVDKGAHQSSTQRLVDKGAHQSSMQRSVDKGAHQSSTQWSVDKGGELTGETLELGGEKAMESARTLLSIGFEIKPC
ncbi:putative transcription factor WRKY family [Rosa chinensis]|uniref:Putative transcription factor WRKY family n=1 Tax=Rosa chinensis TaxID=74649 RepID=A0A2P6RI62_ROSCH|nr:probable WRKY transcription factor 32 isoform X3 [Rosa chinensis]PRQ46124.1 putative transcription factor WRKY family [Rosa chinensis]